MYGISLSDTFADELIKRQSRLQMDANRVVRTLQLSALLSVAGVVQQTGSSVTGLMVQPDIDFIVLCQELNVDRILDTMKPIFQNPNVDEIKYRYYNPTGHLGDMRYYFMIQYYADNITRWTIDIAFWHASTSRNHQARMEQITKELNEEARLAILWIKDTWWGTEGYRGGVKSSDIYNAVLRHGARTPSQFEAYLQEIHQG